MLKSGDKSKLRKTLERTQKDVPAQERGANLIALETTIVEELKERRGRPPKRLYLKFHYSSKEPRRCSFALWFAPPEVCTERPEPEVAADFVVCDEFRHNSRPYCATVLQQRVS